MRNQHSLTVIKLKRQLSTMTTKDNVPISWQPS